MAITNKQRVVGLVAALAVLLVALVALANVLAELLGVHPTWVMAPVIGVTGVGGAIAVTRQFAHARRLTLKNQEAVALLNRGEVGAAGALFDECIAGAKQLREHRSLFQLNRAATHLQLSAPREALALTQPLVDARVWETGLSTMYPHLVAVHVFANAQLGRLDEAEAMLEEHLGALSESQLGTVLSARAVVWGRRGQYDVMAAGLRDGWASAEALQPVRALRTLHALAAFAADRVGDDAACARHWRAIEDRDAAEFAYVGMGWPAFEEFVASSSGDYRRPAP
ncbi:MAG: hypothetical protein AAF721_12130 [Myxococcota bacterium]